MSKRYPELSNAELNKLSFLSENSIEVAEQMIQLNALDSYDNLMALLQNATDVVYGDILTFAEKVSKEPVVYAITEKGKNYNID